MADLQSAVIDPGKIKVRWEEPYTSEAVNRGTTASPRGVYRGFIPSSQATPDMTFRLAIDPTGGGFFADSALLYVDRTNGFGLMVRDSAEPDFDMSARFTAASGTKIPAGGEIWWVWADVDYQTGLTTTGTYHVTLDGDPIPDDAIYMAKITMDAGDTAIESSNFSYTVHTDRTLPVPNKREDGACVAGDQYMGYLNGEEAWNIPTSDQKRAMNAAPTAPTALNPFVTQADTMDKIFAEPFYELVPVLADTKFQLTGWYYVGTSSNVFATAQHFRTYSNLVLTGNYPLIGSDGGIIFVDGLFQSDGVTPLVGSVDANSNGFYLNPYVNLDFSNTVDTTYTGTIRLVSKRRALFSALDQAPALAFPYASMADHDHAQHVQSRTVSGSPSSLTASTAQGGLAELLGYVNDRIKTIHPMALSPDPVLLWRSSAKTLDADVDKNTSSIYWLNGRFFLILGAYLKNITTITAGTGPGNVSMFELTQSGVESYVQENPSAGTDWVYTSVYNWDNYHTQDEDADTFRNDIVIGGSFHLGEATSKIIGLITGTLDMYKLFESTNPASAAKVRILYGGGSYAGLWVTFNADWDNVADEWAADVSDGSQHAVGMGIGPTGFFVCKVEDTQVASSGGTWSSWSDIGMRKNLAASGGVDTTCSHDVVYGDHLYEVIRFGWVDRAAGGATQYFGDVCNFRVKYSTSPTVAEITFGTPSENTKGSGSFGTLGTGNIIDIDHFGLRLQVGTTVNDGDSCRYDNIITIEIVP